MMIQKERIADNVYSFQSNVYAQVNAGAVIGPSWAVLIDTLALPEETLAIRDFIEQELNVPVRYVINTHSHADHAWGNCFLPGSMVIAHPLCRQILEKLPDGPTSVRAARRVPPGEVVSRTEAPRGEVVYYIRSDGSDKPARIKVRTPTITSLISLPDQLEEVTMADVSVVLSGVDLCIACADR